MKKYRINFDLVYSHFLYPAGFSALSLAKQKMKPVFCALGESDFEGAYLPQYTKRECASLLSAFDKVFPNSEALAQVLQSSFSVSRNVIQVNNGVDTTIFYSRGKGVCRELLGIERKIKIVIFVGSFIERKGPSRVMQATRLAKGFKMAFVGAGHQSPEGDDILFCGTLNEEHLALWLNASDIFVLPSKAEGMPNALLEAMACGVSIVASDIEVHRTLLANYKKSVLVPYNDVVSIAEAIRHLGSEVSTSDATVGFEYSLEGRVQNLVSGMQVEPETSQKNRV